MYAVGQVIYLLATKRQKIIPVKVEEQIVRRTIEGEKIEHLVRVPGRDELVNLKSLDVDPYVSLIEVKEMLHQNAAAAINDLLVTAGNVAEKYFSYSGEGDLAPIEDIGTASHDDSHIGGDPVRVQLPSGAVASVKIDESIFDDA